MVGLPERWRLSYASFTGDSSRIDDLTLVSEALILTDKYGTRAARLRLPVEFVIACRLVSEDPLVVLYIRSIHLPGPPNYPTSSSPSL